MRNAIADCPRWILSFICLFLPASAGQGMGQETAIGQEQPSGLYEITVAVDLVQIYATVRDPDGKFAAGLTEKNFEVREDGVLQRVRLFSPEDIPVVVGLVVDHSGSMREKLGEVIAAARSFARSIKPEDRMFVVNFNEHVSLGLRPGLPLTNDLEEMELAIRNAPTEGQTALYDATALALEQLPKEGGAKKVILIISDGGDNRSKHTLAQILQLARQSSTLIYSIGLFTPGDPEQNSGVLRRLARETGGESFAPREGDDIAAICEGIARDIRNQYSLGYVSQGANRPGEYRKIRVTARAEDRGKLHVRARSGYLAITPEKKNEQ